MEGKSDEAEARGKKTAFSKLEKRVLFTCHRTQINVIELKRTQ